MLVKHSGIDLPVIVDLIGKSHRRQNIEGEVLALRSAHIRMAVDPTQTKAAAKIGGDAPVSLHKIVAAAEVDSEIMAFDAAKNRLGQQGEAKLMIAASPVVFVVHAPTHAPGDKFRADFVIVRVAEHAEKISRLQRGFESWRIQRFGGCALRRGGE